MIWRFFKQPESSSPLLSAEAFHEPITAVMDGHLAGSGYVSPKQGVWVKEDCLSGRPMFLLRHYKGAQSAIIPGIALNYVPHFNNAFTKLSWHRTVKSARMDVFPFDELEKTPGLSRFATPEDHAIAVDAALNGTLDMGRDFFRKHQSVEDLPRLFDRLQRYKGRGLGYWNYTNIPVAHAFTLRVLGDDRKGKRILDEYARRHDVSGPALVDLNRRFEEATAGSALY